MDERRLEQSPLTTVASLRNQQTRGLETYASHRAETMKHVADAAARLNSTGGLSISVLGAGNCLDVDLEFLQGRFEKVHLWDLDRASLEHGVQSQLGDGNAENSPPAATIDLLAPFDLAAPLAGLTLASVASPEQVGPICGQLAAPLDCLPVDPADVVLSTCVLSQIIGGLHHLVPQEHPTFLPLLQAIRRGHFRRMLQLLKPGGQGIFVSDLVSSESTPTLESVADSQLPQLLAECIAGCNFFSGLNPGIILQELNTADGLRGACRNIQIHAPWRWHIGPRTYAVFAITFQRL